MKHLINYLKRFLINVTVMSTFFLTSIAYAQTKPIKNIVLVHGAFADGSGWKSVYEILTRKGYHVAIVQNPLTSLKADAEATISVINRQDGPVVLVGHSWGGSVISEAGIHQKVAALVYVAAFVPDKGENTLQWATYLPSPESGLTEPDSSGLVFYQRDKFARGFTGDLSQRESDFMNASQVPIAARSFTAPLQYAAWKNKPSFGIVASEDKSINPETERVMYKRAGAKIIEIKGSHVIYISQPKAVARAIILATGNQTRGVLF